MVLHAALIEQHVAHEQITLEYGALVVGEGGRSDGEISPFDVRQRIHQRLSHRADIALRRTVESGAILEINLLRTLRLQPSQRVQRLRNRFVFGEGCLLYTSDA